MDVPTEASPLDQADPLKKLAAETLPNPEQGDQNETAIEEEATDAELEAFRQAELQAQMQARASKEDALKAIQKQEHVKNRNIELSEDTFGTLFDETGYPRAVKRFTWKNHNNISVQIITYGARITSMKLPDKKGNIADVIMGFDDLAGYLYYDQHFFGATIGRCTNYVENSTFAIHGKQHWVTPNRSPHHFNGGLKGLDKVIWNHYIEDSKVILTYLSNHKEEGYPGDLLVKIIYELTPKNEFSIRMQAVSTKPTIINLSNMTYLNLAGNNTGPEEMYKHMLTINANCYTCMDSRGFPTGEIQNVNYTCFDFQVPKVLVNVLTENDSSGFDQNLCVNRGLEQEEAFIARLLHVPSGRLVEMYSNQCGVNFYTADRLGPGLVDIPVTQEDEKSVVGQVESPLDLVLKLHEKIKGNLEEDKANNYSELRKLIRSLQKNKAPTMEETEEQGAENIQEGETEEEETLIPPLDLAGLKLTPFQLKYLDQMRDITDKVESVTDYTEIRNIINRILEATTDFEGEMEGVEAFLEETTYQMESPGTKRGSKRSILQTSKQSLLQGAEKRPSTGSKKSITSSIKSKNDAEMKKRELENELKRKGMIMPENYIPVQYKDGRIHGKNGCIYQKHGAIVLQTQNYPNAVYHKNFPNCILNPGEIYNHTIIYRFHRQAGNPNKWIKQYNHDLKKKCINVAKTSSRGVVDE